MGIARHSPDAIVIRAFSSITPQQADAITQAVHRTGGGAWIADIAHDYDGYLAILITSTEPATDTVFYVSGTSQNIELCRSHEDDIVPIAAFSDIEALVAKLGVLTRSETAREMQLG